MTRKRNQPKDVASDGSQTKLLDVAIEMFARHGFDAVSTTMIAHAAGLSQSMIHYHFGSKDQLWKVAVTRLMDRRGLIFAEVPRELKDLAPISQLKILFRRLIRANAQEPNFTRILMHEAVGNSERFAWIIDSYVRRGFTVLDTLANQVIEDGAIRPISLPILTNILTSAAAGASLLRSVTAAIYGIDLSKGEPLDDLEDALVSILFNGLAPAPGPLDKG